MIKRILLALIVAGACSAGEYKPLSGEDKKALCNNYKAIEKASEEKNYAAIIKFVPPMLTRFESVLMDPECKKLRSLYIEIRNIYEYSLYAVKIDSMKRTEEKYLEKNDIESALVVIDKILSELKTTDTANVLKIKKQFDSLVVMAEKKNNMATYSILTSLANINRESLKGCQYQMADQFEERIAQLSASMNVDSIVVFKRKYPDVKPELVSEILDRARGGMRQSLVRQPSISDYLHYKTFFGDDRLIREALKRRCFRMAFAVEIPDPMPVKDFVTLFPDDEQKIWKEFEDSLYQKWNAKPSETTAKNYLKLFPEGRYAQNIYDEAAKNGKKSESNQPAEKKL